MRNALWLVASYAVVLCGCAAGPENVSPQEDRALRDNLSRPLNESELKQMGGGAQPTATPGSAPATPPPNKGLPGAG